MAFYIPDEAEYNEDLDKAINKLIFNAVDIISICKKARTPMGDNLYGIKWYFYREEFRKISDALSLVEHDSYLLLDRVTKVSEALWKLYYKENPDAAGTDNPKLSTSEVAAMRDDYFR